MTLGPIDEEMRLMNSYKICDEGTECKQPSNIEMNDPWNEEVTGYYA